MSDAGMTSSNSKPRSNWRDFDWQLLHPEPLQPLQHLALDRVLLDEVAAGRRAPTLRIWEWSRRAIVLGIFQSVKNEVDMAACQQQGFEVVRRITGGGAMLVEPGNAITYSIYAPASLVAGMSFEAAYAYLDNWVLDAFADIGIKAWYKPLNDITSAAGKIGGAAQARSGGGILHHVTMAYDMDATVMTKVLRIGREKLSDKGTKSAAKRVDPLRSQSGMSREAIIDHMIQVFGDQHGLTRGQLTAAEIARADDLIEAKFGTEEWLYKVP